MIIIANPANASGNTAPQNLNIQLGLANGTHAPGRIIVTVEDDGLGSTITQFATNSPTIQGHPRRRRRPPWGPRSISRHPPAVPRPPRSRPTPRRAVRRCCSIRAARGSRRRWCARSRISSGPDGVNDTFLGFTLATLGPFPARMGSLPTTTPACQNNPNYPNFFGTSAATPHAAGIAALMLQANPAATPTQIYTALQKSALPMASPTPNYNSGYGFIQADAALAPVPPGRAEPHASLWPRSSSATRPRSPGRPATPRAARRRAAGAERSRRAGLTL